MWLYNIGIFIYVKCIALAAGWYDKARLWHEGRKGLFERMEAAIKPSDRIVWVHAASLGEFEQGRPVIERVREKYPQYKILVTFFSPSGYEIRKNYEGADYVFYLPADRPSYVRRFLDIVHPEAAIFVKYEFWLNMLAELRRRNVRTYVISAIFRRNSIFFRFYGGMWRRALRSFDRIFVQNAESAGLLAEIGIDNVMVSGDTRFDRVAEIARQARKIELLERFRGSSRLFIAGSTWGPDEELLIRLANENPSVKFVIAPHEMEEERIERLCRSIVGGAVRYTKCTPQTSFDSVQVLVLDTVGLLSSAYGYASWGYIGGGFGVGIHNTLEAAAFGLPVAFGPNYGRFREACDLVAIGAAASVDGYEQLRNWFEPLRDNEEELLKAAGAAREYTVANQGATDIIVSNIGLKTI